MLAVVPLMEMFNGAERVRVLPDPMAKSATVAVGDTPAELVEAVVSTISIDDGAVMEALTVFKPVLTSPSRSVPAVR